VPTQRSFATVSFACARECRGERDRPRKETNITKRNTTIAPFAEHVLRRDRRVVRIDTVVDERRRQRQRAVALLQGPPHRRRFALPHLLNRRRRRQRRQRNEHKKQQTRHTRFGSALGGTAAADDGQGRSPRSRFAPSADSTRNVENTPSLNAALCDRRAGDDNDDDCEDDAR
jgi:hypothetical protein